MKPTNIAGNAITIRNAVIAMQPVASCSDAISRQGLLDTIDRFCDLGKRQLKEIVRDLPSVTPKQRTARWIDCFGGCECSQCGCLEAGYSDYCPDCGCRMFNPQESEEQE